MSGDNAITRRAEEAALILDGEVLPSALAALDRQTLDCWRTAKSPEERECLHLKQAVIAEVRLEILRFVEKAAQSERKNNENGPFRALFARLARPGKEQA